MLPTVARTPQLQTPSMEFDSRTYGRATEALECWRDSLSRSWEMGLANKEDAPRFSARVTMWNIGRTLIGDAEFGPLQTRARRERNIRADQQDHYRLILVRSGNFDCDADGRRVRVTSGRFVITDMTRVESSISSCNSVVMFIPRDQLDRALPRPTNMHGASPENACARILASHLDELQQRMAEATPEELPGLSRATVSLVAASLAHDPATQENARPAIEGALLRQGRRQIEKHLANEELGARMLCEQLQVSRSTLYRMFEPMGGVSQFIKERRLARVHEMLSRPGERHQIARVAAECGFKNAASFSKAFRQQYGYSARQVQPNQVTGAAAQRSGGGRLHGWLGALTA